MKITASILFICLTCKCTWAQTPREAVSKACLYYIEGFYEGDTSKLISSLKPSLYKLGFWKNKQTGNYDPDGTMSYRQALDYAIGVQQKKRFAKPGSPKQVEVLDIGNVIASAKITAWWGTDYLLLSKQDDKWMIEQVIWEGPPVQ